MGNFRGVKLLSCVCVCVCGIGLVCVCGVCVCVWCVWCVYLCVCCVCVCVCVCGVCAGCVVCVVMVCCVCDVCIPCACHSFSTWPLLACLLPVHTHIHTYKHLPHLQICYKICTVVLNKPNLHYNILPIISLVIFKWHMQSYVRITIHSMVYIRFFCSIHYDIM